MSPDPKVKKKCCKRAKSENRKKMQVAGHIKQLLRKDKCIEIFKNYIDDIDHAQIFNNRDVETFVRYKFQRKILEVRYSSLNMLI